MAFMSVIKLTLIVLIFHVLQLDGVFLAHFVISCSESESHMNI
jgi:hypothetical protein